MRAQDAADAGLPALRNKAEVAGLRFEDRGFREVLFDEIDLVGVSVGRQEGETLGDPGILPAVWGRGIIAAHGFDDISAEGAAVVGARLERRVGLVSYEFLEACAPIG